MRRVNTTTAAKAHTTTPSTMMREMTRADFTSASRSSAIWPIWSLRAMIMSAASSKTTAYWLR